MSFRGTLYLAQKEEDFNIFISARKSVPLEKVDKRKINPLFGLFKVKQKFFYNTCERLLTLELYTRSKLLACRTSKIPTLSRPSNYIDYLQNFWKNSYSWLFSK